MDVASLVAELRTQGQLLADAAERAELTDPVPTCPGWHVRDLLLHVGGVHRWAATFVREGRLDPLSLDQPYDIVEHLPSDDGLVDWFRTGHADLVRTLTEAPTDVACWAFLPAPSPLAFWARRQTHETTVHRIDADGATGAGTSAPVDPVLAEDGIDELLTCFVSGRTRRLRAKTERSLLVHTTDTDARWLVRIGPERPRAERADETTTADDTVEGPARALYLALWNRSPWDALTVTGRSTPGELAELWSAGVHVRWS